MTHKLFSSLMIVLIITACAPATSAPTPTTTPVPATSTATIIPTPTLGIGSTLTSDKDGMTLVFVPAGEFTMGSDADDAVAECQKFISDCDWTNFSFTNEEPPHSVQVDAFWIDQTEVTNKMYALCVEAGVCQEPTSTGSETHSNYYGNAEFDNYPVIHVDWNMAKTYCEWVDRRLPTEAEWEKAARGENASVYPWGDTFDGSLVNFCDTNCSFDHANKSFNDGFADVAPVGSYPSGKSVYGALDMAGNVYEWVSSLDRPYPYDATDGRENLLDSSDARLVRGGSWNAAGNFVRSAYRDWHLPTFSYSHLGFRCARSPSATSAPPTSTPLPPTATNLPPTPTAKPTCPEPMEGTQLLMNEEHGYCLLHPAQYNVLYRPMETCLAGVVNSMECQFITFVGLGPNAGISVDEASGRTASQVADAEIAALGSDFNIERTDLSIGGEPAVLMDGIPGQDIVRKVVVIHNDLLYTLSFTPWNMNHTATVNLYTTIVNSLHFLPVDLKPMPTKTMLPAGFQLSIVSPVDGQEIAYVNTYWFQVTDIAGAQGYQWTFSQNGVVVWDTLRDEFGLIAGGTYVIHVGSTAHTRFSPGEVEVAVRALMVGDYYTDATVITIILRRMGGPAPQEP